MPADDTTSHDRLESLVERQQETIEDQEQVIRELRDTVDRLEAERTGVADLPVGRRTALKTGGLLGLLALGVGTASADPQGQVGTETNPLQGLYTLDGPLTGNTAVECLVGPGLTVEDGTLSADFHREAPASLADFHAGMARDDDGTYVVTNDHELQAMAHDLSADYRLGSDVLAMFTNRWNGRNGFDPVGTSSTPFAGTFDGNGYVITGLSIDRGSENGVGLFGRIDSGATLTNVALENATVVGSTDVGGLVGYNDGNVKQSYATGSVSGDQYVGGLVRNNEYTVVQSYATGSVSGSSNVGGLAGQNGGTVEQSYVTGQSSSGATGLTTAQMQGAEAETNMSDLDFLAVWATVDADNDADVSADDYPVLQALDRATQLEVRA